MKCGQVRWIGVGGESPHTAGSRDRSTLRRPRPRQLSRRSAWAGFFASGLQPRWRCLSFIALDLSLSLSLSTHSLFVSFWNICVCDKVLYCCSDLNCCCSRERGEQTSDPTSSIPTPLSPWPLIKAAQGSFLSFCFLLLLEIDRIKYCFCAILLIDLPLTLRLEEIGKSLFFFFFTVLNFFELFLVRADTHTERDWGRGLTERKNRTWSWTEKVGGNTSAKTSERRRLESRKFFVLFFKLSRRELAWHRNRTSNCHGVFDRSRSSANEPRRETFAAFVTKQPTFYKTHTHSILLISHPPLTFCVCVCVL